MGDEVCKDKSVQFFGNAATMNPVFYGFSSKIKTWRFAVCSVPRFCSRLASTFSHDRWTF